MTAGLVSEPKPSETNATTAGVLCRRSLLACGRYDITAFDNYGRYDRISVSVQLSRCLRAFFSFL